MRILSNQLCVFAGGSGQSEDLDRFMTVAEWVREALEGRISKTQTNAIYHKFLPFDLSSILDDYSH